MMSRMGRALPAALALALAACGGDDGGGADAGAAPDSGGEPDAGPSFTPGEAMTLTGDNPAEDEDPSVLRAADGTMVVAYFGSRSGNADLFLTTTRDGTHWTDEVRITTSSEADFAPHLIQTDDGWFHLTWFRRSAAPEYFAHVRHTRTMDLAAWDEGDETEVADADPIEDWVPTIAERPDGDLQIVFVSHIRGESEPHDLYTVTSSDGGETWSEVAPLAALNDAAEQDHLPFLARTGEDEMTITWNRCDAEPAIPWENATSDVLVSTSPDGDSWTEPRAITADDAGGVLDVFPALYPSHAGDWSLVWVTTAIEATGSVVDVALSGVYPDDRGTLPMTGYSPKIAATPTDGIYLGAWVEGPTGQQDIRVRFFADPRL
jgi:BNR repeat protein